MEINEAHIERIERYLRKEMSEAEQAQFETEWDHNPELATLMETYLTNGDCPTPYRTAKSTRQIQAVYMTNANAIAVWYV